MWKLVWSAALWFGAYWLLKKTIEFVRLQTQNSFDGHIFAIGFVVSSVVSTIAIQQLYSTSACLGLRVSINNITQIPLEISCQLFYFLR